MSREYDAWQSSEGQPATLIANNQAEVEAKQATGDSATGPNDWQIVEEEGLLSQCGSSPRSLSDKDLDALDTASQAVPERQPVEIVSDGAADEQVPPSAGTSSLMSSESGAHSANSDIVTEVNEGSDADEEIDAAAIDQETDIFEDADARSAFNSDLQHSAHSSYAHIDLADGQQDESVITDQELSDESSLNESISEEDIPESEALLPDSGVFSIATGYPLDPALFRDNQLFNSEGSTFSMPQILSEELLPVIGRTMDSALASSEFTELAPLTGSQSGSSAASISESHLPVPTNLPSEAGRDRNQSSPMRTSCAAKFLHQIWHRLQMVAKQAGAYVPLSLRKRIAAVLHCLDKQARGGRGSGGIYVAYGAVVVGFLLALRYYRECRTLRQLNLELKNAFDFHVLKVLDLNEKLARGSNIPIVHNCGFKDLSFSRRSYGYRPTGFPPAFLTISS